MNKCIGLMMAMAFSVAPLAACDGTNWSPAEVQIVIPGQSVPNPGSFVSEGLQVSYGGGVLTVNGKRINHPVADLTFSRLCGAQAIQYAVHLSKDDLGNVNLQAQGAGQSDRYGVNFHDTITAVLTGSGNPGAVSVRYEAVQPPASGN